MDRRRATGWFAACLAVQLAVSVGCRRSPSAGPGEATSAQGATWARGTWTYAEYTDGFAWIDFTLSPDWRSGTFTERQYNCPTGSPCTSSGTFEGDATTVTLRSPRWRGRSFRVRTAGNVMEWVDHEVVVARLTKVPPSPPPAPSSSLAWPPPSTPVPPTGTRCDDMTAAQCALSPRCVLEAGSPGYRCRDAAGPCEIGLAQFGDADLEAPCNARPGCRFAPASCFCPCSVQTRVPGPGLGCSCACGGGPPARCVPAQ